MAWRTILVWSKRKKDFQKHAELVTGFLEEIVPRVFELQCSTIAYIFLICKGKNKQCRDIMLRVWYLEKVQV